MKTENLDNLIDELETLKKRECISELGEEKLNEYKIIKQSLSQYDVLISFIKWYLKDEVKRDEPNRIIDIIKRYLSQTNCY